MYRYYDYKVIPSHELHWFMYCFVAMSLVFVIFAINHSQSLFSCLQMLAVLNFTWTNSKILEEDTFIVVFIVVFVGISL